MNLTNDDLKVGIVVYWNDPDRGLSSGYYNLDGWQKDDDGNIFEDAIVYISTAHSEAEVYLHELEIHNTLGQSNATRSRQNK
jgi:hypothetical protein